MSRREMYAALVAAILPLVVSGLIAWGSVTTSVEALAGEREHDRQEFSRQLDRMERQLQSIEEHLRTQKR